MDANNDEIQWKQTLFKKIEKRNKKEAIRKMNDQNEVQQRRKREETKRAR